jgi:hypothetical protein
VSLDVFGIFLSCVLVDILVIVLSIDEAAFCKIRMISWIGCPLFICRYIGNELILIKSASSVFWCQ